LLIVVDRNNRLVGVVSLTDLVLHTVGEVSAGEADEV